MSYQDFDTWAVWGTYPFKTTGDSYANAYCYHDRDCALYKDWGALRYFSHYFDVTQTDIKNNYGQLETGLWMISNAVEGLLTAPVGERFEVNYWQADQTYGGGCKFFLRVRSSTLNTLYVTPTFITPYDFRVTVERQAGTGIVVTIYEIVNSYTLNQLYQRTLSGSSYGDTWRYTQVLTTYNNGSTSYDNARVDNYFIEDPALRLTPNLPEGVKIDDFVDPLKGVEGANVDYLVDDGTFTVDNWHQGRIWTLDNSKVIANTNHAWQRIYPEFPDRDSQGYLIVRGDNRIAFDEGDGYHSWHDDGNGNWREHTYPYDPTLVPVSGTIDNDVAPNFFNDYVQEQWFYKTGAGVMFRNRFINTENSNWDANGRYIFDVAAEEAWDDVYEQGWRYLGIYDYPWYWLNWGVGQGNSEWSMYNWSYAKTLPEGLVTPLLSAEPYWASPWYPFVAVKQTEGTVTFGGGLTGGGSSSADFNDENDWASVHLLGHIGGLISGKVINGIEIKYTRSQVAISGDLLPGDNYTQIFDDSTATYSDNRARTNLSWTAEPTEVRCGGPLWFPWQESFDWQTFYYSQRFGLRLGVKALPGIGSCRANVSDVQFRVFYSN